MWAASRSAREGSEVVGKQCIPEAIWIALSTVCQLERTVAMAARVSTESHILTRRRTLCAIGKGGKLLLQLLHLTSETSTEFAQLFEVLQLGTFLVDALLQGRCLRIRCR